MRRTFTDVDPLRHRVNDEQNQGLLAGHVALTDAQSTAFCPGGPAARMGPCGPFQSGGANPLVDVSSARSPRAGRLDTARSESKPRTASKAPAEHLADAPSRCVACTSARRPRPESMSSVRHPVGCPVLVWRGAASVMNRRVHVRNVDVRLSDGVDPVVVADVRLGGSSQAQQAGGQRQRRRTQSQASS